MSDFDELEMRKRFEDFRGPIGRLSERNPIIHSIINGYAIGQIITKEEALSQMVVMLAGHSDRLISTNLALAMQCGVPAIPEMCRESQIKGDGINKP